MPRPPTNRPSSPFNVNTQVSESILAQFVSPKRKQITTQINFLPPPFFSKVLFTMKRSALSTCLQKKLKGNGQFYTNSKTLCVCGLLAVHSYRLRNACTRTYGLNLARFTSLLSHYERRITLIMRTV